MTRQIGAELVARLKHMNDNLESITPSESDSPQPVASTPDAASTPGEGTSQTGCALTDKEREAVEWFASYGYSGDGVPGRHAATLRGLLDRTKDGEK